jgi:hypothetical protein
VPATLGVVLLFLTRSQFVRIALLSLIALMWVGLILPVAFLGRPSTDFWTNHGCACWLLLGEYVVFSWIGLGFIHRRWGTDGG